MNIDELVAKETRRLDEIENNNDSDDDVLNLSPVSTSL